MSFTAIMLALLLTTACGGVKHFAEENTNQKRTIASSAAQEFLNEEETSLSEELEDRLDSLNSYYLIAHKNLLAFDESIPDKKLEALYQSPSYLRLLAVKTQVEEIEQEIVTIYQLAQEKGVSKRQSMETKIEAYSMLSPLKALALSNLRSKLGMKQFPDIDLDNKKIEREYNQLVKIKEFQIYEKNIDHLSHMMEMKMGTTSGSLTGTEFPGKVWALTFDAGADEKTTGKILQQLNQKKIKATFFQIARKTLKNKNSAQKILEAGMEIGSNSYSYQNLTKVGQLTLEKEITDATLELEKVLKIDIKLFRLPYGAGMNVPSVRNITSQNNMILVNWNVDTLDWMAQTSGKITKRTKKLMQKTAQESGIMLFHDVHDRSVKVSAEIMDYLKLESRRNYTVSKIVEDMNEGVSTVCLNNSL